MTAPNEKPILFADGLGACDLCGAPIVSGLLCADCEEMALEWAGIGEEKEGEDKEDIA